MITSRICANKIAYSLNNYFTSFTNRYSLNGKSSSKQKRANMCYNDINLRSLDIKRFFFNRRFVSSYRIHFSTTQSPYLGVNKYVSLQGIPFKCCFPFQGVQDLHREPLAYTRLCSFISKQVCHNFTESYFCIIMRARILHTLQLITQCNGNMATIEQICIKIPPLQYWPVPTRFMWMLWSLVKFFFPLFWHMSSNKGK